MIITIMFFWIFFFFLVVPLPATFDYIVSFTFNDGIIYSCNVNYNGYLNKIKINVNTMNDTIHNY